MLNDYKSIIVRTHSLFFYTVFKKYLSLGERGKASGFYLFFIIRWQSRNFSYKVRWKFYLDFYHHQDFE